MNDKQTSRPSAEIAARCEAHLAELMDETEGMVFAMIATVDGFAVASATAQGWDLPANRIAAMASSGHALGDSVAGEFGRAACESVIIDADRVSVIFLAIPELTEPPLLLGVGARKSASLGSVLYGATRCARQIGKSEVEAG